MKYTRYNGRPKKKQGSNLLFYVALTLLLALVLGTFVQKFLLKEGNGIWFKNQGQQGQGQTKEPSESGSGNQNEGDSNSAAPITEDENEKDKDGDGEVVKDKYNFYILQCGVFKVQENANKVLDTLKLYGRPFTETEGELTKVYFGVYTDETIGAATELLSSKGIENSKVTITVPVEDLSAGQLCKISENMIEVMNKTYESGVKSLKTSDIKGWVGGLDAIESTMKQYEAVEEMKTYINNLPEEVDKSALQDGMKLIYDKIKAFK
ncbi:MAG: SPOR domain-containing protein [Clostridium sp.]|nr:SPOR domain-containing protein [Clostridium sp.]MDU7083342.1 SPOR domain-containing protein [Clostridium sp.]